MGSYSLYQSVVGEAIPRTGDDAPTPNGQALTGHISELLSSWVSVSLQAVTLDLSCCHCPAGLATGVSQGSWR